MTTQPLLQITDGTTTVNLLSGIDSFYLKEWLPNTTEYRGGGSRVTPLFNDGSWLSGFDFGNVVETFVLSGRWRSPDKFAAGMIELRRLLQQATRFWTSQTNDYDPVYLVARAYGETNTRYAYIVQGRISEENNPFSGPFIQPGLTRVQDEVDLVIERQQWLSAAPDNADDLAATPGQFTFDGVDHGEDATNIYFASLHLRHNITHMYHYDASAATFEGNLVTSIAAGSTVDLFPNPIESNDVLYIGIEDGSAGGITAERFLNVVFDIETSVGAGNISFQWQYYSGGWQDFNSGTNNELIDPYEFDPPFGGNGEYIVTWEQGGSATTEMQAINPGMGVTAFWVRCVATVTASTPTAPTQTGGTVPYTVSWPYFDVSASELKGDLPTLLRYGLTEQASLADPVAGNYSGTSVLALGSRRQARGTDFSPYIWLSSRTGANDSDITVALGANTTNIGPIDETPNGEQALYNPTATSSTYEEVLTISVASALAAEYVGEYRAYLVAMQNGGSVGDLDFRLSLTYSGQVQWEAGPVRPTVVDKPLVIPLGGLSVDYGPGCNTVGDLVFSLKSTQHTTPTASFFEIVLMPTDEWFAVIEMPFDGSDYTTQNYFENDVIIDISSACDPRDPRRTVLRDEATGNILLRPNTPAGRVNRLTPNEAHRVYCFAYSRDVVGSSEQHLVRKYESVFELVTAKKFDRFFSARGSS